MQYRELLDKIDKNQEKIASFGKFDDAILKKINYKLRLDWNYYSNRMEGGTLTKAETRSVMVGNIDIKGKPLKDVVEMNGHDKMVLEVLKMSKGELRIAERRIKEIHKAIMYEEDAEKALQIGKWKTDANEIINYKGEKISFTQPAEVADELHKLIDRANAELDKFYANKPSKHPIEIAAQFHIDFVSVHPFYDGNGRTSRILTNILLMACGYPAIIIKEEQKDGYHKILGDIQAYGGKENLFYEFIANRVLETQQLVLGALEGKEIDELDDVDKEIQLFKNQLAAKEVVGIVKKSNKLIAGIYLKHLKLIFDHLYNKHLTLDELFTENKYNRSINNSHPTNHLENLDYIEEQFRILLGEDPKKSSFYEKEINSIGIGIHHIGFLKDNMNIFDVHFNVYVKFDDYQCHIGDWHKPKHSFLYNEIGDTDKLLKIAKELMKEHLDLIKSQIKKK